MSETDSAPQRGVAVIEAAMPANPGVCRMLDYHVADCRLPNRLKLC